MDYKAQYIRDNKLNAFETIMFIQHGVEGVEYWRERQRRIAQGEVLEPEESVESEEPQERETFETQKRESYTPFSREVALAYLRETKMIPSGNTETYKVA